MTTYSMGLVFVLLIGLAVVFRLKVDNIDGALSLLKDWKQRSTYCSSRTILCTSQCRDCRRTYLKQAGETILAVTLYRTLHDCSLKEAREAIERVNVQLLRPNV
jgi:hypothetical protein